MQLYTVTIPTSPYVKAFASKLYGNPIRIDNKTHIGSFLIGVLNKKTIDVKCIQDKKDLRFKFFIDRLECVAPLNQMDNYGCTLSENHIIQINRYIENLFEETLYFYVQKRIDKNTRYSGYEKAIESFMEDFKMPESVTMDCLKKIEYRFRKKIDNNSIPTLSTPKSSQQTFSFC